jgi:hypothetical protein
MRCFADAFGGNALVELEIFTPTGVFVGSAARVPSINDGPDLALPITLDDVRAYPIDGDRPEHRDETTIEADDVLLLAMPEPELKVHMAWFSVGVEVGPYRISGRLATHPGFDPARALARPGGTFIALSDVTIELTRRDESGAAERPYVLVNRYAVEKVTSSLMLGHFFPGAQLVAQEARTVA